MNETITITAEEYFRLVDKSNMLDALLATGVDNWEGWDDAMEIYAPEKEDI